MSVGTTLCLMTGLNAFLVGVLVGGCRDLFLVSKHAIVSRRGGTGGGWKPISLKRSRFSKASNDSQGLHPSMISVSDAFLVEASER